MAKPCPFSPQPEVQLGINSTPQLPSNFGLDALQSPAKDLCDLGRINELCSPLRGNDLDEDIGIDGLREDDLDEDIGIDELRCPSPDAGCPPSPAALGANTRASSSHEGDLDDDIGIDELRSPSPDAGHTPSPTAFGANTFHSSLRKDDLDEDIGIDELCLPPSDEDIEIDELRCPSPDAGCAPSPAAFGAITCPSSLREDDLDEDIGIEELCLPSPDVSLTPALEVLQPPASVHLDKNIKAEVSEINELRFLFPDSERSPSPIAFGANTLRPPSREDDLDDDDDDIGIDKLRLPAPDSEHAHSPTTSQINTAISSPCEEDIGIDELHLPSPDPAQVGETFDIGIDPRTTERSKSQSSHHQTHLILFWAHSLGMGKATTLSCN